MMPTTREFLGDSLIKELEGAGFSPQSINAFAKNEYRQRKAAQDEEQRRLLYRADDMKLDGKTKEALLSGEINEQEARNAQKFEEFGAKKHGFALGAAKTVTGIANTVERVGDFINPFYEGKRDKDGNYIYQNGLEKSLRPKIKNVEKMRDDYEKATGETSWGSRLAEIGTELVGDPINFVGGVGLLSKGSKLAQFGKKTLYFAGTGAASGGVAALGEGKNDEETLKNIGYGAAGGALLGHAIDKGIQGISKLIAKRQASRMANEANAIDSAQNSEFLDGGNNASGDVSSGNGSLEYPNTQSIAVTIVRGVLKNEPLSTREQVLKEILSGEEKSSVIKPEKYKSILTGINEYKSYQNRLKHFHDNPDEVKNADLVFDQMQDSFIKANSGDTKKYYDAAPLFGRELKIAQTMTTKEFATKEVGLDEDTATNVLKEAMQGKEKSEFIDADSYNDIVKFKNFEIQREYAKAYGEKIQTAQTSINNAREQSAIRYADTQKAINEYQKQGMSASAIRELINAKFKPSADEIDYTRAYNDGADVDARLAGQGIFYALEKDIAAYIYTPEQYFARLKSKGYGDEQAMEFTHTYVQKDINIAKEYVNEKVANAYESRVQREVADEINSENRISINKDGAYRQHPMLRPDEASIGQGDLKNNKLTVARERLASEINIDKLNDEQRGVYDVFVGDKEKTTLQGNDLNDLYTLERGSRKAGGKKIMIKHAGIEKTGGLTNDELLGVEDVVRSGRIAEDSFEQFNDRIRYAYDLKENGIKFRVVIDEYNDGKKVFDYYSDRNFVNYEQDSRGLARTFDPHSRIQVPNATKNIIPQKGNLINEEAKNSALPNGVSSIGDNASRAGGRQGGDEEILRQSGRNTADASEEKWTAKSDRQMEQRSAFKTDGDTDATASSKQMVEKQGRDDEKVGDSFSHFTIDDAINKKLNFINKNNLGKKGWLDDLNLVIKKYGLKDKETKNKFMSVMISDKFKYNREFHHSELKDVMPRISPLSPKYPEISNNAYKELNEIIKNKTIPATKEQNLRFFEEDANGVSEDTLHLHTDTKPAVATGAKEINAKTINANSHIASGLVGGTLNSIDEDGSFNPNRFAAGFLVGLVGSKAAVVALKKVAPKFYYNLMNTAKGFSNKGIKEIRSEIEKTNGIVPIKEFGENYAEFYHNGEGAVQKLLAEKQGQVAGAFYRKELGDIDLVWGKVWQDQKGALQGYGLAKIKAKHPEITAENLDDVIKNGQTKIRQNEAIQIEKDGYKVVLKNNWMGEKTPNKWIVTAYEKERKVSSISSDTFTKGDNHPLTSNEIISQQIQKGAYRDRSNAKSENAKFVQSSDITITSKDVEANAKDSSVLLPTDDHIISQNAKTSSVSSDTFTKGDNLPSTAFEKDSAFASSNESIIARNEEKVYHSRKIEEIKQEHPNVEKELDESIAAMRKESFNDVNFKDDLISKINAKEITTKQLGKSVDLSDKQLAVLKNDIKNADFKVISDSKIYFDKMGKDGDKKRFFIDIAEDGNIRVDAYAKSQIDNIPIKENALQELAGVGDRARLKNMSFEVKAAYFNELDPIKKEAILKTAEYNALKKEMRGIYNVINNGKESTNVYKELQKIDEAIKLDLGSNKKGGGVHIQKHLDPDAKGAVLQQEVMNMGENMREYLKKYKEPFVDKDGGKIYEWQDKDGVRFRVAVYDKFKKSAGAGSTTRITTTDARENIITFYSDRNINARMEFLNPKVRVEAKFEEFKARNLDENGNIKDGLSLC